MLSCRNSRYCCRSDQLMVLSANVTTIVYRDAEVDRLAIGAGLSETQVSTQASIVVIPNYMDVYDFTPVQYPADSGCLANDSL